MQEEDARVVYCRYSRGKRDLVDKKIEWMDDGSGRGRGRKRYMHPPPGTRRGTSSAGLRRDGP